MKYQGYLFDIDGTLLHIGPPTYGEYGPIFQGIDTLFREIGRGRIGIITNIPSPDGGLRKLKFLGLEGLVDPELVFQAGNEAEKALKEKYGEDFKITFESLISNSSESELKIAYDVRGKILEVQKPETYLFEEFLDRTGFNPSRCVMVGDSEDDMEPAIELGMETVYVRDPGRRHHNDPMLNGDIKVDYSVNRGDMKRLREILL